ncbi:MAG: phage holin, LLH family [Ligilactobacillus animalis]|uniref:phage holin, LLH family n=1 Tax=Ligilactobacillus animalis TaxID=1605 RepID=UPI00242D5C20|nr:phage holin, LLH family [Ligilactobacillus animalis]MCI5942089.1 phage holin, LLH family [Ligilactobacillus animalis]MDY2993404.1 phage holin, LLH family [Ligilactobacillus animalis]
MKTANDIFNWLISSGALVSVIAFAWTYVKPWLQAKAKANEAKQSALAWELLERVATAAVESLVSQEFDGQKKFDLATKNVQQAMLTAGFTVNKAAAETAVQSAYEKSDLTPTVKIEEDKQNG